MRFTVAILVTTLIVLTGCGGSGEPSSTPPPTPYASLTVPTQRNLETGEQVSLACGVTLTVPDGYDGLLACFPPQMLGQYDLVVSRQAPRASLIQGFSASSLPPDSPQLERFAASSPPPDGQQTQSPSRWPVIAGSADDPVEVRLAATPVDKSEAMEIIIVIVRNDGKPTGFISVTVYGRAATDDPVAAMAQLNTIWDRFAIGGASLPPLAE